jgi:hypothetical protein
MVALAFRGVFGAASVSKILGLDVDAALKQIELRNRKKGS